MTGLLKKESLSGHGQVEVETEAKVEVEDETEAEVECRMQLTTHRPTQVTTQVRTGLPVLPDELRRVPGGVHCAARRRGNRLEHELVRRGERPEARFEVQREDQPNLEPDPDTPVPARRRPERTTVPRSKPEPAVPDPGLMIVDCRLCCLTLRPDAP